MKKKSRRSGAGLGRKKSNITHVRVCYVNENREIISQFNQSLAMTEQEETEQILACLKRILSGTLGRI